MRIALFGADELGVRCLEGLLDAGRRVVGVVTLPGAEPPSGLLERLMNRPAPAPLEVLARRHRLPILQPARLREESFIEALRGWQPDLLVVSCFDKILPAEVLALAPQGGLNVHPSLLPRHRGPAPVARALLAGDAETGLTVHAMDLTVDTGDIWVQRPFAIAPDDTAGTLSHRLALAAPGVLNEALDALAAGSRAPLSQAGEPLHAPFVSRHEAHLDWRAPVADLLRVIRACSPYPGAFLVIRKEIVGILEARAEQGAAEKPGRVLAVDEQGLLIQAGDGALRCGKLRRGGVMVDPRLFRHLAEPGEALIGGSWSRA